MNQLDKELTQIERRICQNILKYRRIQCLESFNRIYGSMILFLYANAVESLMLNEKNKSPNQTIINPRNLEDLL